MQDTEFLRTLILGIAGVGQTAFVLLYIRFPWWNSLLGRALFYMALMLAVLLDLGTLARGFGFTHTDWLFVFLYALFAAAVWGQFFAFLRIKRSGQENQV